MWCECRNSSRRGGSTTGWSVTSQRIGWETGLTVSRSKGPPYVPCPSTRPTGLSETYTRYRNTEGLSVSWPRVRRKSSGFLSDEDTFRLKGKSHLKTRDGTVTERRVLQFRQLPESNQEDVLQDLTVQWPPHHINNTPIRDSGPTT